MYIVIDESGIHKQDGKSVIALVYIETNNLAKLEVLVTQTEEDLEIKPFHWAHTNWKVREKFISAITRGQFNIKLAIIPNPVKIDASMEEALRHLIVEKHINQILIDGSKPKSYSRKLKKILRDKGVSVKKLRTINDQSSPAMRVADAVAGITRYHSEKPDNQQIKPLYKKIKPKIEIIIQL